MTVVDIFAGAGGWSEGHKHLDLESVGYEFDPVISATAETAGHRRVVGDVSAIDLSTVPTPELLLGGPPCQPWSVAGNGKGRYDRAAVEHLVWVYAQGFDARTMRHHEWQDPRSPLAAEPMRWASTLRPRHIALEQVRAVLPLWELMASYLKLLGYHTWTGLLHSEQYGVPQTRTRAFLMASLDGPVSPPAPTHSRYYPRNPGKLDPAVKKWVSMAEALGQDEGYLRSNYGTGGDPKNRGMRSVHSPAPAVTSKINRNMWVPEPAVPGDTSWVYERPSPTIVGSFSPDVVAAPGWRKAGDGPRQKAAGSVRVTAREAAVLQSFPPDYPWQGSKTKVFTQIGNAVPPLLARAVVDALTNREEA